MIHISPITGMGEVQRGCGLAGVLAGAIERAELLPSAADVLVVTQKIVSKAENRFVSLREIVPGPEAEHLAKTTHKDPRLVELILRESSDVVRAVPNVLITRHRLGLVLANAGVDNSNVGPEGRDTVLTLPADPDRSARELHESLESRWGQSPGIIIADSLGRPWRLGVVNVAIGAWAVPALVDRRGSPDRDGRPLEVTQIALADLIASAGGLVIGEGSEGVAAALIRGLSVQAPPRPASSLVRPVEEDLFR